MHRPYSISNSSKNSQCAGLIVGYVGQGAANRTIHYARGKTLGGSSARNYMVGARYTDLISTSLKDTIRFITG